MAELNVYQKLQQCRVELQNLNLKKSGENSYSKFKYFELSDFLPQINELFLKIGLTSNFSIENELATLTIYNSDLKEIKFTSPIADAQLKGCTLIQSIGAVHTYMKRYLYLNALEIVESDTLDSLVDSDKIKSDKQETVKEIPIGDVDFDIYQQLDTFTTTKEVVIFRKEYIDKVKDKQQFTNAINTKLAGLR